MLGEVPQNFQAKKTCATHLLLQSLGILQRRRSVSPRLVGYIPGKPSAPFLRQKLLVSGVKLSQKNRTLGVPGRDYKWFTNSWLVIQGL